MSVSSSSILMVGGMISSVIDFIAKIASIAPAAPNKCPVMDLVALTHKFLEPLNVFSTAFSSAISPTGVEVACKFK
ncbi:hypothetical protein D3C72_1773190 [compost metagenome]